MNGLRIEIDTATLDELVDHFGSRAAAKAVNATRIYTQKMQQAARSMLQEEDKVDTGRLIQSIQPLVKVRNTTVQGQVNAAAKYARFIHEGAKHEGNNLVPHFVPFAVAQSLWLWAKRNNIIYQKTVKGKKRWFMKGKSGKEYRIDKEKGGLLVKQDPIPYFRTPFETLAPEYFERIKEILQ